MSKGAQSGLRSVQRDWSSSSLKSSQDIQWSSSPLHHSSKQPLSGAQQRLKDIQDALAGKSIPSERSVLPSRSQPLTASKTVNKRSSPDIEIVDPPAKKARQLPPGWKSTDAVSATGSSNIPIDSQYTSTEKKSATSVLPATSTTAAEPKLARVFLSHEQNQILKLVQEGKSVFYTGSAGTGKSVLLREIIKTLRRKHSKASDAVAITASTGIAACNIGGVTIHSFAGIGLGIDSAEHLVQKIRKNKKASARWLRTKVLIIDEVSMLDGELFDKLARVGSILRKKLEPFGGIQLIVTGDFFQLPPVTKGNAQVQFAFEATLWKETVQRTFNLTKVFRQRDQEFVDMLNEMRFGRLSSKSIAKFKSLSRAIEYPDGLAATELFPRREDVDRSNQTRMNRLQTHQEVYGAQDAGTLQDPTQREKILANFMPPALLVLRVDSQVMLIKNLDETLVNGSMGRVVRFVDPGVYGTELDTEACIGEEGTIGGGAGTGPGKKASATVGKPVLYPVVEFLLPSGGKRKVMVTPETWKVELPNGEVQVSRSQFPLILAWAMSIHKSQGQTLERVKVDLGKVFEKGQAYVALSRATSLDGLQVLNFEASKVNAHPKVVQWSKTLESLSEQDD